MKTKDKLVSEQIQEDIIAFGDAQNLTCEQVDKLCQIIADNFIAQS